MSSLLRAIAAGAAAGAAGSTALNTATYLDMAVRGRPASSTPQDTVETIAAKAHTAIPGDEETRSNRLSGLGPLIGVAAGISVGVVGGLVRERTKAPFPLAAAVLGLSVMGLSDGTMTALGVTHPRSWGPSTWLTDLLPHLVYGAATAATYELTQ